MRKESYLRPITPRTVARWVREEKCTEVLVLLNYAELRDILATIDIEKESLQKLFDLFPISFKKNYCYCDACNSNQMLVFRMESNYTYFSFCLECLRKAVYEFDDPEIAELVAAALGMIPLALQMTAQT